MGGLTWQGFLVGSLLGAIFNVIYYYYLRRRRRCSHCGVLGEYDTMLTLLKSQSKSGKKEHYHIQCWNKLAEEDKLEGIIKR